MGFKMKYSNNLYLGVSQETFYKYRIEVKCKKKIISQQKKQNLFVSKHQTWWDILNIYCLTLCGKAINLTSIACNQSFLNAAGWVSHPIPAYWSPKGSGGCGGKRRAVGNWGRAPPPGAKRNWSSYSSGRKSQKPCRQTGQKKNWVNN